MTSARVLPSGTAYPHRQHGTLLEALQPRCHKGVLWRVCNAVLVPPVRRAWRLSSMPASSGAGTRKAEAATSAHEKATVPLRSALVRPPWTVVFEGH